MVCMYVVVQMNFTKSRKCASQVVSIAKLFNQTRSIHWFEFFFHVFVEILNSSIHIFGKISTICIELLQHFEFEFGIHILFNTIKCSVYNATACQMDFILKFSCSNTSTKMKYVLCNQDNPYL